MAEADRTSGMDNDNQRRKISEKIAEIDAVAEDIPAVVIIHNIRNLTVEYMSPRGRRILNVSLEELKQMGADYFTRFFNPEDARDYVPRIVDLITRNNCDEVISFFQQVRASEAHPWDWYFSTTKILLRDDEGLPLLSITQAYPVDSIDHRMNKIDELLEDVNFQRNNIAKFATLTDRECEVLRLLALGKSVAETASEISMAEVTVERYRSNIRKKLNVGSVFELIQFAKVFKLI